MTKTISAAQLDTDEDAAGVLYVLGTDEADARRRFNTWHGVTCESAEVMRTSGLAGSLHNVRTRGARRIREGNRIFRFSGQTENPLVQVVSE